MPAEAGQNEIMALTIVNFIFLPLGLISWTFTMRTEGMPFIDSQCFLDRARYYAHCRIDFDCILY